MSWLIEEKVFDQTIRNDIKTYENFRKIATDQEDHAQLAA